MTTTAGATDDRDAAARQPPLRLGDDGSLPDDASDHTVSARFVPVAPNQDRREYTVQFDFQPKTAAAGGRVALVHTHILQALQTSFKDDLDILDNNGAVLARIDPVAWATPTLHQQHFKVHTKTTGPSGKRVTRYYVLHRIRTSQGLSTLRRHYAVAPLLNEHNCYMRAHSWDETVWDVQQAGVFIGLHPQYYDAAAGEALLKAKLKAAKVCPEKQLPAFRLVYKTPRIKLNGRTHSTKAYVIEIERKSARHAMRVFKEAFRNTHQFLPSKMRYTHPELFAKGLKGQDQYLKSIYCIPLLNLPSESLFYLQPHFQRIEGFRDILSTKSSETLGKYNFLVSKDAFKAARSSLEQGLSQVYNEHVPVDAKARPGTFAGEPCVAVSDGYGSDDSGYSASFATASYASLDLTVASGPDVGNVVAFPPVTGVYVWDKSPQLAPDPLPPLAAPAPVPDPQSVSEVTTAQTPELDALVAKLDQVQADNKAKEATIAQQGADISQLTQQIGSLQTSIAHQSQQLAALLALLQPPGSAVARSAPVLQSPSAASALPTERSGGDLLTSVTKRPPPEDGELRQSGGKHFRMDG